jgi:hypothetical protein
MPKNESKTYWKEVSLIILGALLAITGGALTSWLTFELQDSASNYKAEIERQSILAGFQAEVEVNLIKLNNRFERYEMALEKDAQLSIRPNEFSFSIYNSNLPHIGNIQDLALITEIIAFYDGLKSIDDWESSLRREKANNTENDKKRYVSQLANFLHAGIFLQARMANSSSDLSRVLPTPKFNNAQRDLLERIKKVRVILGAHPSKKSLSFHDFLQNDENK